MAQTIINVTGPGVVYSDPQPLRTPKPDFISVAGIKFGVPAASDLVRWGQIDLVFHEVGLDDYLVCQESFPWYGYGAVRLVPVPYSLPYTIKIRLWPAPQTIGKTVLLDLQQLP